MSLRSFEGEWDTPLSLTQVRGCFSCSETAVSAWVKAAPARVRVQFPLAYAIAAAMQREELNRYLDGLLEVSRFRNYCPNGLQVEERAEIWRVVSGVSARLDPIQAAFALQVARR